MCSIHARGLGWHRDLPDVHDYTPHHVDVRRLMAGLQASHESPERVNWQEYCHKVDDQGPLQSSAAQACIGLLQYYHRRATGQLLEGSMMYVYKMARRRLNWEGDTGASLRAAWKSVVRFGVPPEWMCPQDPDRFDEDPHASAYAYARDYESLRYVRLDDRSATGEETLRAVKSFLAAGFPCVFGFPVYTCVTAEPEISFPTFRDTLRGGQAVVAIGYDDHIRIRSVKGAIRIRNSWGADWGDGGYGWLPYEYVREKLAGDFWTTLRSDWLASGEFVRPSISIPSRRKNAAKLRGAHHARESNNVIKRT